MDDLTDNQLVGGLMLAILFVGFLIFENLHYGGYLGCAVEVGGVAFGCPR